MHTTAQSATQPNFFSLFETQPNPQLTPQLTPNPPPNQATDAAPLASAAAASIVSPAQRRLLQHSPYAPFVCGKSLAELAILTCTIGTDLFRKSSKSSLAASRYHEWSDTFRAAHTVALEAEYRKIDERFCHAEKGAVYLLIGADKTPQRISYAYTPDYFPSSSRCSSPVHHLEFKSAGASQISETGYRSHFLTAIPYGEVSSFADFMVKILRLHLKVTAPVIFDGVTYEFDPAMIPKPPQKKKKADCRLCGVPLEKDGTCLDCTGEDFEDGNDFENDGDFGSDENEDEDSDLFGDDDDEENDD